jgi:dihydrolipoamide dehydrogenase
MGDHLIPAADKDLLQPLMQTLNNGCRIMTGARVAAMAPRDHDIQVDFSGTDDGETGHYDTVLTAIGRRPNTEGIGLDALGLKVDEHGFIPVDERQQTAAAHCYAIGDVVGEPMLAHKASHQGKVAAEVIAGRKTAFTPMTIPSVVYTSPELAWMGITERQARERGIDYARGSFAWKGSGRALCSAAENGVSKLLFDRATGRIIGAGICGIQAGELIHEVVLALEMGADAEDIGRTVHAHPTLSETIALAAEMVAGSITDAMPPKK